MPAQVFLEETAPKALEKAMALKNEDDRLFIAGSLYLVGEIKRILSK